MELQEKNSRAMRRVVSDAKVFRYDGKLRPNPEELNDALGELEDELVRFEENCNKFNEYQEATTTIAKVWAKWLMQQKEDEGNVIIDENPSVCNKVGNQ